MKTVDEKAKTRLREILGVSAKESEEMLKEMEKQTLEQKLAEKLRDFVWWWDDWSQCPDSCEVEDPFIEDARKLLQESGYWKRNPYPWFEWYYENEEIPEEDKKKLNTNDYPLCEYPQFFSANKK